LNGGIGGTNRGALCGTKPLLVPAALFVSQPFSRPLCFLGRSEVAAGDHAPHGVQSAVLAPGPHLADRFYADSILIVHELMLLVLPQQRASLASRYCASPRAEADAGKLATVPSGTFLDIVTTSTDRSDESFIRQCPDYQRPIADAADSYFLPVHQCYEPVTLALERPALSLVWSNP
jgi:hypothetical protein